VQQSYLVTCLLMRHSWVIHCSLIKEKRIHDEMFEACIKHTENEKFVLCFGRETSREETTSGDLDLRGKIVLK